MDSILFDNIIESDNYLVGTHRNMRPALLLFHLLQFFNCQLSFYETSIKAPNIINQILNQIRSAVNTF